MKRAAILTTLITLCQMASAQGPSLNAQPEPEQTMLRIQREKVAASIRDLMEIREYTHPLLKKYLPNHRFYLSYIPSRNISKASYLTGLGVVDRENRFSLFSNSQRSFLDLGRMFLFFINVPVD